MYETFIEIITDWYYWMVIISLIIGFVSAYIHNTGIPILFTVLLSVILVLGKEYLYTLIKGVEHIDYSLLGILLGVFSISWMIIMFITHFNMAFHGEVVK